MPNRLSHLEPVVNADALKHSGRASSSGSGSKNIGHRHAQNTEIWQPANQLTQKCWVCKHIIHCWVGVFEPID